jgi:hypothetical protein
MLDLLIWQQPLMADVLLSMLCLMRQHLHSDNHRKKVL